MPTFRREDLERLEKEHEKVLSESMDTDDEPSELDDEANGGVDEPIVKDENAAAVSDADRKDKEI